MLFIDGTLAEIEGDKIPLCIVDESVVSGKVFPMLLHKAGSVEIKVPEGRLIVYQHLIHVLKALSAVKISIPLTVASLAKKMKSPNKLVKELKSIKYTEVTEIRAELSIQGYYTFDAAADLAKGYIPVDRLPDGVKVGKVIQFSRYLFRIHAVIDDIKMRKLFTGRNESKLTSLQKHYLAKLYNSLGFSIGCWIRYLEEPCFPSMTIAKAKVRSGDVPVSEKELQEIQKSSFNGLHKLAHTVAATFHTKSTSQH